MKKLAVTPRREIIYSGSDCQILRILQKNKEDLFEMTIYEIPARSNDIHTLHVALKGDEFKPLSAFQLRFDYSGRQKLCNIIGTLNLTAGLEFGIPF